MSAPSVHDDWLSLIEISGPFLAVPVLKESFPQGLEELDATKRKRLRQAYEEWREALELEDAQFAELHAAWIDEVLSRGLELDEDGKGDVLKRADWCAANLQASLPEHSVALSPDLAVIDEQRANKPLLLIQTYAQDVDLDVILRQDGWAATPADRMVQLCRSLGCRLGLVTNGERWMLVDAPVGAVTTFSSWYARIWSQEPITLQAFVHLLGIRRFYVDESEQLPALFDRSLKFQDEVTDALGEQVRRAVEVLIQTLDKADQDRNRELLHDVKEPELYEAALTVMMRMVFLLSAEERGLLLMGDERYEANYALSTLRMQLRKESEEILERRWDAWSRLLAIFRAVFGGIEHENLRLPALGGSLFDPDRFPFLEGRAKGSNWRSDAAKPLPIDNRTVLLLLEAIQQFQGRTLSYRALDVEQIGYVYEGLLERTVKRTDEVTLELDATKSAKTPWVKLAELDSARLDSAARLAELLQERSGSSASRVRNDLAKPVDDTLTERLLTACQGDTKLRDHVKPYAHLLRTDPWGYPLVYPAGAFIVTTGSDRRETGTHYTPKSLTEAIVAETLTPVAYVGPAEGTAREQWALKSPAELLDLKICDPAMGSGAFLVQACRWLSDRLVEAWAQVEATGKAVSVDGEVLEAGAVKEPLPRDSEARTVIARRLVAERCLYGVDLNPLAVELAKLSIWLVTLAKGRPFGFLDHNLRCGDSLLGIHRLDQLTELSMSPGRKGERSGHLFGQNIEKAVLDAIELRQRLRDMPIRDIRDVEAMARLDVDARRSLEIPERIADALVGETFASSDGRSATEGAIAAMVIRASQALEGQLDAMHSIIQRTKITLPSDATTGRSHRPFHWPLEFPEVFSKGANGFNAVVGNPPFMGGKKLTGHFGESYRNFIVQQVADGTKGVADLCVFFFLRAIGLLGNAACSGLVVTSSLIEGDTREVGLDRLPTIGGDIYSAFGSRIWPGKASVTFCMLWVTKAKWNGIRLLDGKEVRGISPSLTEARHVSETPFPLFENNRLSHIGSFIHGQGFVLSEEEAKYYRRIDERNQEVLFPYMRGGDFTSSPALSPQVWVINFHDWPEERAKQYKELYAIVNEKVKPERDKVKRAVYRDRWWQFAEKQKSLYEAISSLKRVLFHGFTTKYLAFGFLPASYIYGAPHVVIALDDDASFAVLQSGIHESWVRRYTSYLGQTMRYIVSDVFVTFPFPAMSDGLSQIGFDYYQMRQGIMAERGEGLTSIYNRFNDPSEMSDDIRALRNLHCQLDIEVADAYGWDDLIGKNRDGLKHGFHQTKIGLRWVIDPEVALQIIDRLLILNNERHAEELKSGKHQKTKKTTKKPVAPSPGCFPAQQGLNFDSDPIASEGGTQGVSVVILSYMRSQLSWHSKSEILAATGVSENQWNAAIRDLISRGDIECQGEKRGARYLATVVNEAAQ